MKSGPLICGLAALSVAACAGRAPRTVHQFEGVTIIRPVQTETARRAVVGERLYEESAQVRYAAAAIKEPLPTVAKEHVWPAGTRLKKFERGGEIQYCKVVNRKSDLAKHLRGFHCYRDSKGDGTLDTYIYARLKSNDGWLAVVSPVAYAAVAASRGKLVKDPVPIKPVAYDESFLVSQDAARPTLKRVVDLTSMNEKEIGVTYRARPVGTDQTGKTAYEYNQGYRFNWREDTARIEIGALAIDARRTAEDAIEFTVQSGFAPWVVHDKEKPDTIKTTVKPDTDLGKPDADLLTE